VDQDKQYEYQPTRPGNQSISEHAMFQGTRRGY